MKDDDSQWQRCWILRVFDSFVRSNEGFKTFWRGYGKQFPILDAFPSPVFDGFDIVAWKEEAQIDRQALIEKKLHAAGDLSRLCRARSKTACACSGLTDGNCRRNSCIG